MASQRARSTNTLGTRLGAIQSAVSDLEARTRTPADNGLEGRLETVERTLELISSANYRAEEELQVRGSNYARALLDPSYVGPGPARVIVGFESGGTLSATPYPWRGDYHPSGNRVVNMIRIDGYWYIDGHSSEALNLAGTVGYGGSVILEPLNGWTAYSDSTGSFQYSRPQAQRLPSGIVVLSGLVASGAVSAGTVITVLPEGMRPDESSIYPVMQGSAWRSMLIRPDGRVEVRNGWTASFVSLDGISFPAAGVASWTDVGAPGSGSGFSNGWTGFSTSVHGTVGYWKDQYGLVWFKGLVGGGSRAADNTTIITLPIGSRPYMEQHYPATADDGFGLLGAKASALTYKTGTTGSSWISLSGVNVVTDEARSAGTWVAGGYFNGWSEYNSTLYPVLATTRRGDGLGLSVGLVKNGTIGTRISGMVGQAIPRMSSLQARPSGGGVGRLDLAGYQGRSDAFPAGAFSLNFGVNGWVSLDGMTWMVNGA